MPPSRRLSPRQFTLLKAGLFIICLAPSCIYAATVFLSAEPPADPVQYLTYQTGEMALRMLVTTLAMTPLRLLTGAHSPVKLRGMFGLFTFFYALCHFTVYLLLDLQLDFSLVWDDIVERKYITVGFTAFLLLLPLAITSNAFSIRRMGSKWLTLHRAVYAIGILAAVHFLWIKRAKDIGEPLIYLFIICALLSLRLPAVQGFIKRKRARNN